MVAPKNARTTMPASPNPSKGVVTVVIFGVLLGLLAIAVHQLRDIVSALVTAFGIAYILNPFVDRLEKCRIKRGRAVALMLIVFVLSILLFIMFVVPVIYTQLGEFMHALPDKLHRLYAGLDLFVSSHFGIQLPRSSTEILEEIRPNLEENRAEILKQIGTFLRGAVQNTIGCIVVVLNVLIIPMFTVHVLIDFHQIKKTLIELIPRSLLPKLEKYLAELDDILANFFRGQLILVAAMAIYYSFAFLLVDVPMAIVVGLLSGFATMIPYLGPLTAIVLGLVMMLSEATGAVQLGGFFAVIVVAQLLEGFVLTPRLIGKRLGLSPLATILSFLAFGQLFGFLGLLLAIPLAAITKIAWAELKQKYKTSSTYNR